MKIRLKYDWLFDADRRDEVALAARRNVMAHQLAGLVEFMPELPEVLNAKTFEVEVV